MPKNPHADFSPVLNGYSGIGAFRFWCQTALPLTYDDSLSYYELLNKVVSYLNHTIEDLTAVESNTSALAEAYNKLQKYVNDYFDDLDVKAELRNVLDAMAEDGTLDALLDPLVENQLPGVVDEKIDAVVAEQIDDAVAGQIDESVADQLPALVDAGIPGEVSDWLEENVDPVGSAVMVDSSLTISGAAADAKVTGDELSDLKSVANVKNIEFIKDKALYCNISPVDITNIVDADGWKYAIIDVSAGEEFTISVSGGVRALAWCFINNDGEILKLSQPSITLSNALIVAPAESSKMILNGKTTDSPSYYGNLIGKQVNELQKALDLQAKRSYNLTYKDFESGTYTGEALPLENNARIRTKRYMTFKGETITMIPGTVCNYIAYGLYNADGVPIGNTNWFDTEQTILINSETYIVFMSKSGSAGTTIIEPSDFDGTITFELTQNGEKSDTIEFKNQFIRTNVNPGDVVNMTLEDYPNWKTYVCECNEGDKFNITGHGGNGSRLWAFVDNANKLINKSSAHLSMSEEEIIAPTGAAILIVGTTTTCDHNLFVFAHPTSKSLINRSKVYTPIITEPNDLFVKPVVSYRNHNIQEDTDTVCTKFGIFKSGNNFCVTYAENITHSNSDAPDLSETGTMRYRYRYFKLNDNIESGIIYGDVAKKGTSYVDIDGNTKLLVGGVSFGSSVNNRLFFSSAYRNEEIPAAYSPSKMDYMPCTCEVTIDDNGVSFGTIYELKLIVNAISGKFNVTRFGGWMKEYYTSCPPYHDSNGYKWLIPCESGFAYLTSTDGITWTLQNICELSYQPYKEVSCIGISNNRLIFSARLYDEDDTMVDGNYTVVGIYDINANTAECQYRITSEHAKTFLARIGTQDIGILYVTDAGMKHATCYLVHTVDFKKGLYFIKWFEIYADATFYSAILQDTLSALNFTEMYIVGGNGKITNHASGFLKLTFDSSKPRTIDNVPFCVV